LWQCDDEIKVQFTDDGVSDYELWVYDSSDSVLDTFTFSEEIQRSTTEFLDFYNPNFLTGIQGWDSFAGSNRSSAQSFAWEDLVSGTDNAICDATASGYENSQYFASENLIDGIGFWPIGDYEIEIIGWNQSIGNPDNVGVTIWGMNNSTSQTSITTVNTLGSGNLPTGGALTTLRMTFSLSSEYKYLAVALTRQGGGGAFDIICHLTQIKLITAPGIFLNTVYETSFVPSVNSPDLCDQQIQLKIVNMTSSPEAEVYRSDCLDIRTLQSCTTLIEYSNNRNFAGLIYTGVSPEQTFNIRVPAIFFHEQFPEEDEAMELTTGIQKTSGTMKVQRLFETDYMPYYMHKKLKLIFKHQFLTIDNASWLKEEAYDVQEGDRRWPVKKAKCFLTENYIQRAVL